MALQDSPVVLLHGPRQCGKTTLAQVVGAARGFTYYTFDDAVTLAAATADPVGFVDDLPDRVVLDEIQRAPALFTSIKRSVDRDRRPGRFLLTGSANVLLVPSLADSLAGRMEIVRLHPLARAEVAGDAPHFLDSLFAGAFTARPYERLRDGLAERITGGGYPAALARSSARRRATWYRDYVESLVQRDVRDLARIRALDAIPRLLDMAASQTARVVNVAELGAPLQLSRPTIAEYLTLLERVFLVERLQPWHHNRLSRLIKTPKLHLTDTGVACAVLGLDADALAADRGTLGQLLESFVVQELRREASGRDDDIRFHHFRDRDGVEVDLILEQGGRRVAGVEVKASATVTAADFRALAKVRDTVGARFAAGVVLYDGESSLRFGDRMFAVPIRAMWDLSA
jgi:hypothetical protein